MGWRAAAIAAVFSLAQIYVNGQSFSDAGLPALATVLILMATVCSAGLWTLATRSVIGGTTFTIAAQFPVGLAAYVAYEHLFKRQPASPDSDIGLGITLTVAALVYC